ncbi:MAG: hypothetical protein RL026_1029 [Pseudomonadota bacterium]
MNPALHGEAPPGLPSHTVEAVGREIALSLADARAALEAHVEQEGESRLLKRCADEIHASRGALRLLGCHGSALVAEEIEHSLAYLAVHAGAPQAAEVLEVLMRAMVQLPGHVERVMAGATDTPLVLLPLLNDLRAGRGEALLSEGALLSLNLKSDKAPPPRAVVPASDVLSVAQWARRLRSRYQTALVGWIRGEAPATQLAVLAEVAQRLEESATTSAVHQLWWVMGAVLEALRANTLEAGGTVKRLVGLGDRELRRLYEQGESRYALQPPVELLNNLLYYVARDGGDGPRVRAVRESFRLADRLPVDDTVDEVRQQLSAPSIRLMHSVASALREELGRIKDVLDIFTRRGAATPEELGPQVEALRKVADTLGLLGLGEQRVRLLEQTHRLAAVAASRERPEESLLVDIASAIIQIEDPLDDALQAQVMPQRQAGAAEGREPDFRPVRAAVLRECLVNLAQIKDYVGQALAGEAGRLGVDNWRELLRGVQAALELLERPLAASMTGRLAGPLRRLLLPGGQFPVAGLDRLADAVVGLEYYLEALQADRIEPVYMLDNVGSALQQLESLPAIQPMPEPVAVAAHESTQVLPPDFPQPSAEAGRTPPAPPVVPRPLPAEPVADPELLGLYLEESRELLQRIQSLFAAWDHNPLDEVSLRDLRRAFHTLKGSGRVVGARGISEFAWSIENLLNRLLDQTLTRSPEILDLLRDALLAMPELIEQIATGHKPRADVERLMTEAHALAAGRPRSSVVMPEPLPPAPDAPVVPAPAPVPVATPPSVTVTDQVLRDIFARETDGHVQAVRDFLEQAASEPAPHLLTEAVYRACHTLAGTSRVADARHGIRLAQPLDHWLRKNFESRAGLTNEDLTLLDDCMRAMLDVTRHLDEGTGYFRSHDHLIARIEAAEHDLDARIAAAEAASVAGTAAEADSHGYDPDIAAVFSDEATELLEAVQSQLAAFAAPASSLDGLKRPLHTLKGGARLAGVLPMGDLAHELESLILRIDAGRVPRDSAVLGLLQDAVDELARMRDLLSAGRAVGPATPLLDRLAAAGALTLLPLPPEPQPEPEPVPEPAPETAEAPPQTRSQDAEVAAAPALAVLPPGREPVAPAERQELARVDAELLDELLNGAGEISVARARIEQQLGAVESNLGELARTVTRLKEQLRKLEIATEAQIRHRHEIDSPDPAGFDPLELDRYSAIQQYSRALAETASDVDSLQQLLVNQGSEAQNLLQQQGRALTELQHGLLRTRMVSFQRPAQRLARLVRQVAQESGKTAELVVEGSSHEMDRQVVERMIPPLEHLVRNAVIHGIEMPAQRGVAGKPEAGRIDLALRREGAEVILRVSDDGAGMDLAAIRRKGEALGMIAPDQVLGDEDLMQLVLEPGFSTAATVTQVAGRGVGMDVVASEIKKLGGSLRMETRPRAGTTFTIRLPFTLAVSHALVVRVGDEWYALPLPTIDGVVRVERDDVAQMLADPGAMHEHAGHRYRLQYLAPFVGLEPSGLPEQAGPMPVVLVQAGEHSAGLLVDELIGSREIVVKNVGPQIASIRGISGATILNDGRIVVILDIGALLRAGWRSRSGTLARPKADDRPVALVVDDSITVRRVTQRLLERNGMRVLTARDGVDAMALLQEQRPDILLLDIEMPRMDGYEVARQVREDPRTRDLPIIMITSRTGDKHRSRAMELGVNEYLGKPYQESQLLDAMGPLLAQRHGQGQP